MKTKAEVEHEVVESASTLIEEWAKLPAELRERIQSRFPPNFNKTFVDLDGLAGVLGWMNKTGRNTNRV